MGRAKELLLRHPPSLARVSVHVPAPDRKWFIFAAFLVLHCVAFKACIDTSGDAYKVAVERVRKINREHHLNGTKPEDMPPQEPLPSTWAPNAWASAALFSTVSLHVFFHLLCHWKVRFRVLALYRDARAVCEGCYMQVTPHAHRGSAALVPVWFSEVSGRLGFVFQRQRYEYWEEVDAMEVGEVKLVHSPVDEPIPWYFQATGLHSDDDVEERKERFGPNVLEVEMPTFLACYREQLLTPLVIFQVFVALLWAADDFVQYTLMQLVFILVFESTSVMQRLKTMKMLNSMGTKPYSIMVFRARQWTEVSTAELLPGDLVELAVKVPRPPRLQAAQAAQAAESNVVMTSEPAEPAAEQVAPDIVPCDCLIVRGEAVASEASLTGESAPQMKDAITVEDRMLDMHGVDRVHCLFSGTRLLRSSEGRGSSHHAGPTQLIAPQAESCASGLSQVPATPGGGCLCFVVRTGFASSQGELLQMIEFSQQKVSGDTKEVLVALLILLAFALVAAGYVLKTGLEKGDRTPHELLIKCVIILTAVVPRQLPMQTAVAVNTALMALIRAGVYCTEPHRVPLAGKLTHCMFDKTGTLTTDTLLPAGVVSADGPIDAAIGCPLKTPVREASPAAALVLAACHSLVAVDGQLSGDPIEVAALSGVGWQYDAEAETATPLPNAASVEEPSVESVRILHRFHFASHLQRMAVIAEVSLRAPSCGGLLQESGLYCLVKGSPEALTPLLMPGSTPAWFETAHTELAEHGLRVLALACRRLAPLKPDDRPNREDIERDLTFVGFIAFECRSRADSALVIGALRESDHQVAMLTGDSPLTALHVARTCGIANGERPGLLLTTAPVGLEDSSAGGPSWVVLTGECRGQRHPLSADVTTLAESFSLVTAGDALDAALAVHPDFWENIDKIKVFARMTPQGKAMVIRQLQKRGQHVLMCGDGGNDVGALKQADVGLALLAGYGNVNTTDTAAAAASVAGVGAEAGSSGALQPAEAGGLGGQGGQGGQGGGAGGGQGQGTKPAEVALNERQLALEKRTKETSKARQKYLWEKQKELNELHKQWLQEEMDARAQRGENGVFAQVGAVKTVLARYTAELKRVMKEFDQQHGNVYDAEASGREADALTKDAEKKLQASLEGAGAGAGAGGLPMVRPGDASVAAPFTSKAPSVKNCVDLIRQGRCTLLSALQQQQIMMLNCIINAYVLSALSLEGSRSSERQMMSSHWLLTTASLAFAYSSPCDRMHPVRPLRSLFHPAVFVSMLGQAAIHLACMVTAVKMARGVMAEDSPERLAGWSGPSLKEVSEFWRRERLRRRGLLDKGESEDSDWSAMFLELWTQPFLPNLMNTVVFLVETSQTVAILFVNYKGQPWMRGVTENRALFLSVFVVAASVAAAAWEFSPELNALIHLSPFPNDQFRFGIMGLVGTTLIGTLIWDRLCVALFAPNIFRAMLQSARATTFSADVLPIFKTAGKVLVVFVLLGTGNPLLLIGAIWWYRKATREE